MNNNLHNLNKSYIQPISSKITPADRWDHIKADGGIMPPFAHTVRGRSSITGFNQIINLKAGDIMDLITVTKEKDSKFSVQIRKHTFFSDMSIKDGGNDEAPSPVELLVGSLGACIGMTINKYCVSHGYDSENIGLSMTYQLEKSPIRIKNITIDIELPENFPDDRRRAILNLVKSCPIHNTLRITPEIDIEIEK